MKDKIEDVVSAVLAVVSIVVLTIVFAVLACGCASDRARNIELEGMYVSQSGTLAIGAVDIMASTTAGESATIKYSEDTAWLSPSTKTHEIKIQLTGTNAVASASNIVNSICNAFVSVGSKDKEGVANGQGVTQ